MGLLMERIYWIEKVVAVEKQVRFFLIFGETQIPSTLGTGAQRKEENNFS
jgi:hypothetical protein